MFSFLKRKRRPDASVDDTLVRLSVIIERKSFRDNELKLIRSTITKRRKEVYNNKNLNQREKHLVLDSLNIIEKHAVDVAFLMNRERMQELGAPKQRRQSHTYGVDMGA